MLKRNFQIENDEGERLGTSWFTPCFCTALSRGKFKMTNQGRRFDSRTTCYYEPLDGSSILAEAINVIDFNKDSV